MPYIAAGGIVVTLAIFILDFILGGQPVDDTSKK